MSGFRDLAGLTRAAIIVVIIHATLDAAHAAGLVYVAGLVEAAAPDLMAVARIVDLIDVGNLVALIAAYVVVGRWIYVASANAHLFSDEMTISPGWAVGWYCIPIANLFKPFQAMRETWLASNYRGNWHGEPSPGLLGWWWGLWLVNNALANIAARLTFSDPQAALTQPALSLDVGASATNVVLCAVLIAVMRRLVVAQRNAAHDETFA